MPERALFLDRDGVINLDHGYVHKREDFHFVDGIFDLVAQALLKRYKVLVITNQAGIARGFYSENEFLDLTSWMCKVFRDRNAPITKVYYCPNHPDGLGDYKKVDSRRKPSPGMLMEAKEDFDLDLSSSILVGDQMTDVEAGLSAGVGRNILFKQSNSTINTDTDIFYQQVSHLTQAKKFLL